MEQTENKDETKRNEFLTYKREWYKKNKDRVNEQRRLRFANDTEFALRTKGHSKKYALKNKDKLNEKSKEYYYARVSTDRVGHNRKQLEWRTRNKELVNARQLARYHSDEDFRVKNRIKFLHRKYGINEDDYNKLYDSQKGKCAICGKERKKYRLKDGLVVDHCHNSGKVRGLLCSKCNLGIGNLEDSVLLLRNAISYLESLKEE